MLRVDCTYLFLKLKVCVKYADRHSNQASRPDSFVFTFSAPDLSYMAFLSTWRAQSEQSRQLLQDHLFYEPVTNISHTALVMKFERFGWIPAFNNFVQLLGDIFSLLVCDSIPAVSQVLAADKRPGMTDLVQLQVVADPASLQHRQWPTHQDLACHLWWLHWDCHRWEGWKFMKSIRFFNKGNRVIHLFVFSSLASSEIEVTSGLGASPVLHTRRPKLTAGIYLLRHE